MSKPKNKIIALVFTDLALVLDANGGKWFDIPAHTCAHYLGTVSQVLAEIELNNRGNFTRIDISKSFSEDAASAEYEKAIKVTPALPPVPPSETPAGGTEMGTPPPATSQEQTDTAALNS